MTHFILPKLKPQVSTLNVNNCCYEFRCVCGSRYIGETKLMLETRASQHRTDQKSKIANHIQYCREYNLALADYGEEISGNRTNSNSRPSWNIPRNFHLQHYSVLGKNYKNVFHRKTSEGIFINTQNPDLNCQVYHKRTSLFCNHFASFGRASDRGITWGPTNVFACQNLQKFENLHFLTATENSPFNLKMIINRNRSLRLHWKDFEYEKEMSKR